MTNQSFQIRQGDVFLVRIDKKDFPKGKIQPKAAQTILALGEVTGHKHRLEAPTKAEMPTVVLKGIRRHLEVCYTLPLVHEEHSTIEIPPGYYEQRDQLTWDYTEQLAKQVVD